MVKRAILALWLFVAFPAFGQDGPRIVGPSVPTLEHRMVRLRLEGEAKSVLWDVIPLDGRIAAVDTEPPGADAPTLAFTGPPGQYRVTAVALMGDSQVRIRPFLVKIVPDDGTVDPPTLPPDPPTDPEPDPAAITPIRQAGRDYSRNNGEVLRVAGRWVKANPGSSKAALMEFLAAKRGPVAEAFHKALDTAINPHVNNDATGTFKNPDGVARALDEAGRGVGSP